MYTGSREPSQPHHPETIGGNGPPSRFATSMFEFRAAATCTKTEKELLLPFSRIARVISRLCSLPLSLVKLPILELTNHLGVHPCPML